METRLWIHRCAGWGTLVAAVLSLQPPLTTSRAQGLGAAGDGGVSDPDRFTRRAEWLHRQRAFPLGAIPPGARSRALDDIRRAHAGGTTARGGVLRTWHNFGPEPIRSQDGLKLDAGRVTALAVDPADPRHWFLGAAQGGIWETWDAGASWDPRTDDQPSLAMGTIVFAPGNPNIVYAGTGEANFSADSYAGAGLLKSSNRGATWSLLAADRFAQTAFSDIRVHPTVSETLVAATARGILGPVAAGTNLPPAAPPRGVFTSTDGGATWTQRLWGEATDLETDPGDFSRQYAALGEILGAPSNGVYRSTSSGETWAKIDGPWAGLLAATDMGRIEMALAPSQPATLYVSVARKRGVSGEALLGIWRTSNAWAATPAWALISSPGTPWTSGDQAAIWYYHELSVHPTNPSMVLWGGFALWRYDGNSWSEILPSSVHVDQHAIAWQPVATGYRFVLGNDGGVWTAFPDASDWANHNESLAITQFYEGSVHPGSGDALVLGGSQDNGTEAYSGGIQWRQIDGGDGGDNAISASQPDKHWAVSYQTSPGRINIRRTKDGGKNIANASLDISAADAPFLVRFEKHPTLDDLFIAGTVRLWRTANFFSAPGRPSWAANGPVLNRPDGVPAEVTALAFAPADHAGTTYAYATDDGQLRITANGGGDWADLDPANAVPGRYVTDLAFDPQDSMVLYVSLSGFDEGTPSAPGHLFRTANALAGAPAWTDVSPPVNLPHNTIAISPLNTSVIYVGTDLGVWVTSDAGGSWSHLGPESGMPNVAVFELQMDTTGALTAFTHGRGAFVLRFKLPKVYEVACPLPCQMGWVNPLDLVTIDLPLYCTIQDTVNLVARLRTTAQVTAKSGPQTYGALAANGTSVSRVFSFQPGGVTGGPGLAQPGGARCGEVVTLIFDLEEEGRSLGSVDVAYRLGRPNRPLLEDFEQSTPPALPDAWRSTSSGAGTSWTVTTNPPPNFNPGPNPDRVYDPIGPRGLRNLALYAPAPDFRSDAMLYSPVTVLTRPYVELSFRHSFDFKTERDAGVLELAVGGGEFADPERVFGRFEEGGYNALVRADTVLLGRPAWTGDSGGYIATRITLPPLRIGETIQWRWRSVTAGEGRGVGWWVDDVELIEYDCANPVPDPLLLRARWVEGRVELEFPTVRDRTYILDSQAGLAESRWAPVRWIAGDGAEQTVNLEPGEPHLFYRLRVE